MSIGGEIDFAATVEVDGQGRASGIWMVRNPEKLGHLSRDVRLT